MEVHLLHSTNIFINLAMEQSLFLSMRRRPAQRLLLIWKNDPCVVMGRFQNPWLECDLEKMRSHNVGLARRQSGGGTVYHDRGNLNASFLDWNENYSKESNNHILIQTLNQTLKERGLTAFASGRSDIQIETAQGNRKVSGAAFKKKKDRSFHHATMLLNSQLDLLNQYLTPKYDQEQMSTKAIASVRANVANIQVCENDFKSSLIKNFENFHKQKAQIFEWDEARILKRLEGRRDYYHHLISWEWIYGETPLFETCLQEADWSARLKVKKGVIKEALLEHEGLHPSFLQEMSVLLEKTKLTKASLKECFKNSLAKSYEKEAGLLEKMLTQAFTPL
ncbi:MAG: lipoate--protein ligase [Bacteriovoracaceae bacterium]